MEHQGSHFQTVYLSCKSQSFPKLTQISLLHLHNNRSASLSSLRGHFSLDYNIHYQEYFTSPMGGLGRYFKATLPPED